MAFKHISLLWSAKVMIMGHVGDTAFLQGQKTHITRPHGWYHHILSTLVFDSAFGIKKANLSEKKMYDKQIMIWQFSYHNPHQPETPISAIYSGWYGCFLFVFLFRFYGPFKNISLISSGSFIKGGRKPNPGKNHWPSVSRNWLSHGYRCLGLIWGMI